MKLDTLVEVGFCLSYGDSDYRISMKVADLSREKFNELQLGMLSAIHQVREIWLREQEKKNPAMQAAANPDALLRARAKGE